MRFIVRSLFLCAPFLALVACGDLRVEFTPNDGGVQTTDSGQGTGDGAGFDDEGGDGGGGDGSCFDCDGGGGDGSFEDDGSSSDGFFFDDGSDGFSGDGGFQAGDGGSLD
jgi:hypothetical protein